MPRITALRLVRKPSDEADVTSPPTIDELEAGAQGAFDALVAHVRQSAAANGAVAFMIVEREMVDLVLAVGRTAVVLFLGLREQHVARAERVDGLTRTLRPAPPIARNLMTWFGTVRYWRQ